MLSPKEREPRRRVDVGDEWSSPYLLPKEGEPRRPLLKRLECFALPLGG